MSIPLFSLCHATRRLPVGWKESADVWFERCDQPDEIEYIIAVDSDANDCAPILTPAAPQFGAVARVINSGVKSSTAAWNTAARFSTGQFIITIADDLFPPLHWDTEIHKLVPDFSKEAVLWPDLSGDYDIMTFCFVTRPYFERLTREHGYEGGICYPQYRGMRADDDFTACAKLDAVIVEARDLKFTHKHPTYGTAEWDETYYWQHRPEAFQVGDSVLERRRREGFRK